MKGTFFQKPLEYGLEIQGESWKQGDKVSGTLSVKDHGGGDLSKVGVSLAMVDMKKFKAKDPKGVQILTHIPNNGTESLDWEFQLAADSPITEKANSLYILCGDQEKPFEGGHLQLQVDPVATLSNFLEIFENFFRFKVKGLKNKKGWVEAKMASPGSRELGAVEQLLLHMKMNGEDLELKYQFKVKKLAYAETGVEAKSVKMDFEQVLGPKQYKMFGDAPNQDGMMKAISEIIDQIKGSTTY